VNQQIKSLLRYVIDFEQKLPLTAHQPHDFADPKMQMSQRFPLKERTRCQPRSPRQRVDLIEGLTEAGSVSCGPCTGATPVEVTLCRTATQLHIIVHQQLRADTAMGSGYR